MLNKYSYTFSTFRRLYSEYVHGEDQKVLKPPYLSAALISVEESSRVQVTSPFSFTAVKNNVKECRSCKTSDCYSFEFRIVVLKTAGSRSSFCVEVE